MLTTIGEVESELLKRRLLPDMRFKRLYRPDNAFVKALITGRSIFDIAAMLFHNPSGRSFRLAWLILQVKPRYTMVTNAHLVNLYDLVQKVNALNLPGDLVECGVWNGGSAALMAVSCREDEYWRKRRNLWLFDSFQGLPKPGKKDGKRATDSFSEGWCKGSIKKVQRVFAGFGISMEQVIVVPGWFDSTLRTAAVEQIALLHIDADWYDSVKVALETFYDKIVPGGFVILDDYGYWPGCVEAVDDFLRENDLGDVVLERADRFGAHFRKPIPPSQASSLH